MDRRRLGRTGFRVSPIGFGAFKIGRNEQIKYEEPFDLPSDDDATQLLLHLVDAGINYIDTAPAYGLSEERIGRALADRRDPIVISTKVGEQFEEGRSYYDYSRDAVEVSIAQSLTRLGRKTLDIVFVHSNGNDMAILETTEVVQTLCDLRTLGTIEAIGFSGKTIDGARAALDWADVLMMEYHLNDQSHADVIEEAAAHDVGIVIKKGLDSGRLQPADAIPFVLRNSHIATMVIGGLSLEHVQQNLAIAEACPGR